MAPISSRTDSSTNIKQRRESDLTVKYYDEVQETEVRAPEYELRQYAESAVGVDWPLERNDLPTLRQALPPYTFLLLDDVYVSLKFRLIPPSVIRDKTVCKKFFATVHGLLDTEDLNTRLLRNFCDSTGRHIVASRGLAYSSPSVFQNLQTN
jgi:hypothetical protein